jgi:4-amino-4-deoxy-L-arabinose transferase-like glycosyltransferase
MPISPRWGLPPGRALDCAAVALLIAVAAIVALTFRDYGLGWDDYTHAQYGDLLLRLYGSGFADRRALSFVNLYAYGGGFDMVAALLAKLLPLDLFETRRLAGGLVGLAGLAATWRLGRRAGGPLAGLIALALIATCPLYVGHMYMNPKDGPFAAAMALCMLALVRTVDEYPTPARATGALAGVGLGLAIGTRVLGGFAVLYAIVALLAVFAIEARRLGARPAATRVGGFLLRLLPWLVLAYAVMALVWPWSVASPLNPLKALVYFSTFFEQPWRELFQGSLVLVPDMPRRYVAQLFALTLPEIMLALGLAGAAIAFIAAFDRRPSPQRRAVHLMLALAATLPIALTIALRPAMYNGIRHFVCVAPAIAVVGGLAGARLIEHLAVWRPAAAAGAAAVLAAGIALPAIEMTRLHPYEYTYFNRIEGGVRGADGRYMLDYWGLSLNQASDALLAKITAGELAPLGDPPWRIAVCGPHPPAAVALGPRFDISWDPRGADFAMTLGEYYCAKLAAPVILEIAREGVVYARVYDLRGLSFDTLLSVPAPR